MPPPACKNAAEQPAHATAAPGRRKHQPTEQDLARRVSADCFAACVRAAARASTACARECAPAPLSLSVSLGARALAFLCLFACARGSRARMSWSVRLRAHVFRPCVRMCLRAGLRWCATGEGRHTEDNIETPCPLSPRATAAAAAAAYPLLVQSTRPLLRCGLPTAESVSTTESGAATQSHHRGVEGGLQCWRKLAPAPAGAGPIPRLADSDLEWRTRGVPAATANAISMQRQP